MPVLSLTTLARQIDERTANERLLATISGYLGGLALILAGIGIYGIVAYTVQQRTAELGLRIALGASHRHVLWHVARGTIAVMVTGVGLGIVLALRASDMLSSILFGLPPSDPRVYVTAAAVLFITGIIATVPPVRRAFRIDPIVTLRYE
jgi:ABC-type antimicrobial peptide transport system permease subunit